MPPMMPSPMFMPPPKRGGGGLAIALTLIGLTLFVGVVIVGLVLFIAAGSSADGPQRKTVQSGSASQTVAVIPVTGVIINETEQRFRRDLDLIRNDSNVKALVVTISSPGGTVTDSDQMYHALLDYKSLTGNPVVIHMDAVAASGGYYLACAGDAIFAEETTITGSIGVLLQYPQLAGFAEKTGIKLETIIADGSPRKGFLDTFSEPDAADLADAKTLLNNQYDLFRSVVASARSSAIAEAGSTLDEVASGAVFLGGPAKEMGLVDEIGYLDDAVADAASRAGLTDPNVIRIEPPPTLFELLGAEGGVRVNGERASSLAIELLHEATAPRGLYLYNGVR
jgi:protease-4